MISPENENLLDSDDDLERTKRHVYSFSEDFDAYDTFSVSNVRNGHTFSFIPNYFLFLAFWHNSYNKFKYDN